MFFKKHSLRLACLLVGIGWIGWTGTAQATGPIHGFLLAPLGPPPGGSGGELQIGTGLPLPIGPPGVFVGGMFLSTAGTPAGTMAGGWPPLFVPPAVPGLGIIQTLTASLAGGKMLIPAGVLAKAAPGAPVPIGVFPTNPALLQVATTVSYSWPAVAASFAPGGAPGALVTGSGLGAGFKIIYSGGAFGGAAQFAIAPGPGAAVKGRILGVGAMGNPAIATVWAPFPPGALPGTVMTALVIGASANTGAPGGGLLAAGASLGALPGTTLFGPPPSNFGLVNGVTPCCTVTPSGLIASSIVFPGGTGLTNRVYFSKGFPWSTGLISISAPGVPPEKFFLSGTDMRVSGVGNISLVSGALSSRKLSGPNANRGWISLTLPEPTAALGAAGALLMLGLCHGLVRRRSR